MGASGWLGLRESRSLATSHNARIPYAYLVIAQVLASHPRPPTFLKRSSDSRRAACVMSPCSSPAGGSPASPNRIFSLQRRAGQQQEG